MEQVWVGIDIGKHHHHAVVIDSHGTRLLSRRIDNDEATLLKLIDDVAALADRAEWAVDMITGGSALLLALLAQAGQQVFYITGNQVNRAADGYRGSGKTDAKDAAIIADQVRIRRDLIPLRVDDELIVELRMLIARRRDLAGDRVRQVNRLHQQLLAISPALERVLDLTRKGPLILLTCYQTPEALRRAGTAAVEQQLRERRVQGAAALARKAVAAAASQQITLPGQQMAAQLVAGTAEEVINLETQNPPPRLPDSRPIRRPQLDISIENQRAECHAAAGSARYCRVEGEERRQPEPAASCRFNRVPEHS